MRKLGNFIFETVQIVIFAVSIFLFIYLLVAQPHKIKGDSMLPNFSDGEFLLTNKVSYRTGQPERGDIIVFQPPGADQDFIKRIVGLPGENVAVSGGGVFINGNKLVEPYVEPGVQTNPGKFFPDGESRIVPVDSYFVLGDNRENSLDSRNFGFATGAKISGKAWFVYWPIDDAGKIAHVEFSN